MKKPNLNKHFDKQFGLFVKKKRLQKGWSQADLADKIGNNYQNISRLERGEITPTLFWCYKLAEAFEVSLTTFLKNFDNPKNG
jgi:ribosome-binding protein aMBF1 (putative translation factor)